MADSDIELFLGVEARVLGFPPITGHGVHGGLPHERGRLTHGDGVAGIEGVAHVLGVCAVGDGSSTLTVGSEHSP